MLCHSASVRILAPPLALFPIPLVSAPVPASPYLRHANLGESVLRSAVSYRVSSARFRIRSDQVPSQHLKALSMRLKQSRADHLRCFSSPPDANPLPSKPWQFSAACADQCRTCSLPSRSMRHFAVSSLLFVHPVEASQIHCFSAQSTSPRSLLHLAYPSRFVSMPSSRLPSVSVRRHSTRGLSASLRGDSGLRTSLAMPFTSVPLHCLALRFGTPLRSAVSTLCLSGLLHAVTTLRIFGIRRSLLPSSRLPSWPSLPSLQPPPSGPPRCGCRR